MESHNILALLQTFGQKYLTILEIWLVFSNYQLVIYYKVAYTIANKVEEKCIVFLSQVFL